MMVDKDNKKTQKVLQNPDIAFQTEYARILSLRQWLILRELMSSKSSSFTQIYITLLLVQWNTAAELLFPFVSAPCLTGDNISSRKCTTLYGDM
jgi:hypothetical protein